MYNYKRRKSVEVKIGELKLGGSNPIRVQSMANTNTNDIAGSVAQCRDIVAVGGELVRFTTQGLKEAESLRKIHIEVADLQTPLVADVHFNANVADLVAKFLEKVRINPGNYVSGIKIEGENYTDEEFTQEFEKIKERFEQLLAICHSHKTAIRIGVNHGSLSERMMNRYGNTAEGMVESCLEFLRIAEKNCFSDIIISMKSSNTVTMIQAVRLLVEEMNKEGMCYPIHLGVTEAGDGEDGRIKSAVGIGALLADGIGDTIRVSLSEAPQVEIPVAKLLRDYIVSREGHQHIVLKNNKKTDTLPFTKRQTHPIESIGGHNTPIVIGKEILEKSPTPDFILVHNHIEDQKGNKFNIITPSQLGEETEHTVWLKMSYDQLTPEIVAALKRHQNVILLIYSIHRNIVGELRAFIHTLTAEGVTTPIVLWGEYSTQTAEELQVKAAADFGVIFVEGLADGICLLSNETVVSHKVTTSIAFGILQAARVRVSKTEFISCPGCGRTLFNLETVIDRIKKRTSHLVGLKIGIMGCIVNGPGEMADADYGYVGAGKGTVSLYKGQNCVKRGIAEKDAVEALINLIKENGDWKEPQ